MKGVIGEVKLNQGFKSKIVILIFRFSGLYNKNKLIGFPFFLMNKLINELVFCVEIPTKTKIGYGLRIFHPHAIVINENVTIGENCIIRQGVTIGNTILRDGTESKSPIVGSDVEFGANSLVIGNVTIGDRCRIGAGAVVTKSLKADTTVVSYGFRQL